jgi:hypothetical protein
MALPPDNVARFEALQSTYPEARFTFEAGWYYGSLRGEDEIIRASDLGRLIDALLAEEEGSL